MSDRTFRILFTVIFACLGAWTAPYMDTLAVIFLVISTIAAYVIAYNIPPYLRTLRAQIEALHG